MRRHVIPLSPEWLGPAPLPALVTVTLLVIVAVLSGTPYMYRRSTEIVTTCCARRWFEDTTTLGGLTVDYEQTTCDWSAAGPRVGCTVPVRSFEPAYVECVPVAETLVFGSCSCTMPPAGE